MESVTDGDEFEKLLKQELELEEKLLSLNYEFMLITFDNEEKVLSVSYDKETCELSPSTAKQLKTTPALSQSSMLLYSAANSIKISAAADFKDGSYKLSYVPAAAFAQLDATKTEPQRLVWEDDWCEYTASFTFSRSANLTVKGYENKNFTIKLAIADDDTPENYTIEMTLSGSSEWRGRLAENDDFAPYLGYTNLITKLTVGKGVTGVNGIFSDYNFEKLETVVLSEGLKYIEYYTFGFNVKNINIPASVTNLGQTALSGGDFTEINYGGTKAQWNAIQKDDDWNYGCDSITVHCTDGDVEIESTYNY